MVILRRTLRASCQASNLSPWPQLRQKAQTFPLPRVASRKVGEGISCIDGHRLWTAIQAREHNGNKSLGFGPGGGWITPYDVSGRRIRR
jgi:hypothetical protein